MTEVRSPAADRITINVEFKGQRVHITTDVDRYFPTYAYVHAVRAAADAVVRNLEGLE